MTALQLTHIGGPTVLLELDGWRLLTDPTFDAPGRRYRFGWGTSSRKVAGPAVAAADIGPIDAVLLTHDHHADNLDDAGRRLVSELGVPVLTTMAGVRRLGPPARGLAPWAVTTLERPGSPTITVTATPCRHGPPGSHPIVGDVVGFALAWDGQQHGPLWITGDTVLYPDVAAVPARVDPGTVLVHLGGVRFPITGPVRYTMTADDAVALLAGARAPTVVPVHYEGWSHFHGDRAASERAFDAGGLGGRVRWAVPGTPLAIEC
jgi:L-ascorbate metabolism protein UlaG (beta-lactamase superfamily)